MADTDSPDELVGALTSAFSKYSSEIRDKIDSRVEEIGNEAVEEVKSLSPVYTGKSKKLKKGKYRKGWRCEIEKSRGKIEVTVHNKQYQLTHLLENQHLNRDGTTFSTPHPHISIANDHAEKKVDKLIEELAHGTE